MLCNVTKPFQCLPGLSDQPRIFHRNDRLVGEGAHQFDLTLAERLHLVPREINRAEHEANAGKVIAWVGMAMFAALAAGAPLGTTLYGFGGFGSIASRRR